MDIAIYTLTSELHDEESVKKATEEFLSTLTADFDFYANQYESYGSAPLSLIYVRTGGTEGIFKRIYQELMAKSSAPFYLLTSGKSNSLAASMEILSFLRQQGIQGEILHGSAIYINQRIAQLLQVGKARESLRRCRLGIVGKPSDWLISSETNREKVLEKLGITLVDIEMQELLDAIEAIPDSKVDDTLMQKAPSEAIRKALPGALRIYHALKRLVEKYQLQGFTLRCFDLLSTVHNTGCWALAQFNSEGIVASCEGDVPAMLSMKIAHALTGCTGFQANPARINPDTGEMLFAHCTIPFSMTERYELDTHFESGIGVGIRGFVKPGPVTIFKVSGDLSRHFAEEGELLSCQSESGLCRTQQIIRFPHPSLTHYFLTNPIGNHHIILPSHCKSLLEELLSSETPVGID